VSTARREWPEFPRTGAWFETREYLHLVGQMLGKVSLSLAPALPQWFHTPLALSARGLTTRFVPLPPGSVEVELDVADHVLRLAASGSSTVAIPLFPARPISDVWRDFRAALAQLGLPTAIWDKPQERTDALPFSQDDRPRQYDRELATAWFAVLTEIHGVFEDWRSPFFGRSGVQFWWGGFDLTVTLFNGRRATPPVGSNYIQRYDLTAEHLTVGFWPGDTDSPAMFFGYVVPEPPGCTDYELKTPSASWAPDTAEWVLRYDEVRQADDRLTIVKAFADRIYAAARDLGGWPIEDFTYVRPPRREVNS
jgi:hypothetical protein